MTHDDLDTDKAYSHPNWSGVALRYDSPVQKWVPDTYFVDDPDDPFETIEVVDEYGEGKWVDDLDSPMVQVHMIGDDQNIIVDADGLTVLDEDDYCGGCGQIGCGWC